MATTKVVPVLLLTIVIGSCIVGITEADFCVANPNASPELLKDALGWACARISCGPIQPGGACYLPNTLRDHATFAFDTYYHQWSLLDPNPCEIGGASIITQTNPSHGTCKLYYSERNNNTKSKGMVTQKTRKLAQTLPSQTQ